MTKKTKRIIDGLIEDARADYKARQEAPENLEELKRLFNDPGHIKNKQMALTVCKILIRLNIEGGVIDEGSIVHLLGLRLMDYIERGCKTDE
jgi:hypothetical protein